MIVKLTHGNSIITQQECFMYNIHEKQKTNKKINPKKSTKKTMAVFSQTFATCKKDLVHLLTSARNNIGFHFILALRSVSHIDLKQKCYPVKIWINYHQTLASFTNVR